MFLVSNEILAWLAEYISRAADPGPAYRAYAGSAPNPTSPACRHGRKRRAKRLAVDGSTARLAAARAPSRIGPVFLKRLVEALPG